MSVLEFQAPEHGRTPVLVEVPHAGLNIPAALRGEILATPEALKRDADLHVNLLYQSVPEVGAGLLTALLSRYVVDLNRAPDDIDLESGQGARVGQPRGVVWRVTTEGQPVLRKPLDVGGIQQRVDLYHAPYHARLRAELDAIKSRFGFAILVAGHSMPSAVRRGAREVERRADVVPGSLSRTSADPRVIDLVETVFRAAGLSVRHDEPYRGGFTTAHYGRPNEGIHAIQIEVNRALYMDELTCEVKPGDFEKLQIILKDLVERLGQLDLGPGRS
ncbi:MAG: N-formylglutamate amidohydrolase [Myxococcales bacterium]